MESQKIKYTNDGKKVIVLGSLNSQEKIVQEVFIVDGSEIPSGEHFVVKSLHDAPSISWKEKNLIEIEKIYDIEYRQWSHNLETIQKDFKFKVQVIQEKLSFLRKLDIGLSKKKTEQLIDFISGNVNFVVYERYGDIDVCAYDETISTKDYGRFDYIRLLSVFGRTDGNLDYKMNEYYDGSGSWSKITPFKTEEEAIDYLKDVFYKKLKDGLTESLIKVAEKYKIDIPKDSMDKYKEKRVGEINKNIESVEIQLKRLQDNLKQVENS